MHARNVSFNLRAFVSIYVYSIHYESALRVVVRSEDMLQYCMLAKFASFYFLHHIINNSGDFANVAAIRCHEHRLHSVALQVHAQPLADTIVSARAKVVRGFVRKDNITIELVPDLLGVFLFFCPGDDALSGLKDQEHNPIVALGFDSVRQSGEEVRFVAYNALDFFAELLQVERKTAICDVDNVLYLKIEHFDVHAGHLKQLRVYRCSVKRGSYTAGARADGLARPKEQTSGFWVPQPYHSRGKSFGVEFCKRYFFGEQI